MLIIYTGNGKGKTSACVGQALRAIGQGLTVAFGQFMKCTDQSGEQRILQQLLGTFFKVGGKGFFLHNKDKDLHRQAALKTLTWSKNILKKVDMLILDEVLYALNSSLLTDEEIESLIKTSVKLNRHLVISGRNAPIWLIEIADIVTEMLEIKHPWHNGTKSEPGIEF